MSFLGGNLQDVILRDKKLLLCLLHLLLRLRSFTGMLFFWLAHQNVAFFEIRFKFLLNAINEICIKLHWLNYSLSMGKYLQNEFFIN